jgi:hypothetical protein
MATKRSATAAAPTDAAPAPAEFYRIAGETDAAGVALDFAQVRARRAGPAPSMFCAKSSTHSRIVILLVIAAEI